MGVINIWVFCVSECGISYHHVGWESINHYPSWIASWLWKVLTVMVDMIQHVIDLYPKLLDPKGLKKKSPTIITLIVLLYILKEWNHQRVLIISYRSVIYFKIFQDKKWYLINIYKKIYASSYQHGMINENLSEGFLLWKV